MGDNLLILLLGVFTFLSLGSFLLLYHKNRFRLINAVLFYITIGVNSFFFLLLFMTYNNTFTLSLVLVSFFLPYFTLLMGALFGLFAILFLLSLSANTMRKKERFSLANRLSLFLLLGLIAFLALTIVGVYAHFFSNQIFFYVWNFGFSILFILFIHLFLFITSTVLCHIVPPPKKQDYIIVLGSGLVNGKVTPLLGSRIDKAIDFYRKQQKKTGKPPILLFSGGKGISEPVAEAEAMAEYARAFAIPETHILIEDQSKNTYENILFSKKIMEESSGSRPFSAIFSTNSYHVFRAGILARRVGIPINGIGSRTKLYYRINALLREYIAYLSLYKKRYVIYLAIFTLLSFLISFGSILLTQA